MKITPIPTPEPPPAFKPVTLQLTFETQEELDCFGTMFNHPKIMGKLFKGKPVRNVLDANWMRAELCNLGSHHDNLSNLTL